MVASGSNGQTHKSITRLCLSLYKHCLFTPCLLPEEGQVSFPKCQPWEKPLQGELAQSCPLEGKGQSPPVLGECQASANPSSQVNHLPNCLPPIWGAIKPTTSCLSKSFQQGPRLAQSRRRCEGNPEALLGSALAQCLGEQFGRTSETSVQEKLWPQGNIF